ncbi:Post-GPI attachment to proteins factor 3 [Heracleum sosnowskyi]|uniref:Post-GPI attachment to proteins factor 3 n=1 Tax=Heracleum sosnowskyi TaxID=360622 RepID=A0AAD8HFS2_9APIA|nr:Post-GPI attachment to proteins factor 3 [Heracleum sosnowskyi]
MEMGQCSFVVFFSATIFSLAAVLAASTGDSDPNYIACVDECEKTGCVAAKCFQHCKFSSDGKSIDGPWEEEREKLGEKPAKYHGKWPFRRVFGIQEPVSVALSGLNLAMQFQGWVSFFILVNYKLPLRPDRKTYYEYTGLWHVYAILSMNAWLWSSVFHSRDVDITEKLDYSSAIALLGFSLILAIIRVFSVRTEAARVMVAAPLLAFVTTHILYLNFYQFDYGLNMKVCVAMGVVQILLWAIWAGVTRHPSRWKLWVVVVGGGLAGLLEIYDFPPYKGFVDAHALWHATTVPLSFLWWSFIRDDSEFRTSALIRKIK